MADSHVLVTFRPPPAVRDALDQAFHGSADVTYPRGIGVLGSPA
jgi:hypothetical protein